MTDPSQASPPPPEPVPLTLAELARGIAHATVHGDASTVVRGLFQDSRRVTPGAIFAVRSGQKAQGEAFLDEAFTRGAVAVLSADATLVERTVLPVIVVPDIALAIAQASLHAYGNPERALTIIGITGTNGKTTTSRLVTSMLQGLGLRAAVLGTLGAQFGSVSLPGVRTTPEADDLARTMATLVSLGATHLTMEVSSHALTLGRVLGLPFRVTAFLNLTHDHLDFHGDLEAYGAAKRKLFTDWPEARAVINVDDAFGAKLAEAGEPLTVSPTGARGATLRAFASDLTAHGVSALFESARGRAKIKSSLVGAHNLENLGVALGIGLALDLDIDQIALALGAAGAVPGRLERCSDPDDARLVVVDYAHTPDALGRVLDALRPLTTGTLWCVFGCGGDRDAAKRPVMGEVAARKADQIVVTNDNPRSEAPALIAEAITPGVVAGGKVPVVLLDRREAIRHAIGHANAGDTVLIAGKGHEPYQIVGETTFAFDDRDEARDAIVAFPTSPHARPLGQDAVAETAH